jgi:hypothetical protein
MGGAAYLAREPRRFNQSWRWSLYLDAAISATR